MSDEFHFKSFAIQQNRCAMKIGTDAILLGAWSSTLEPKTILDIGTGTGVIALMLAQRFPTAIIDAIEIDPVASEQARCNFSRSAWKNRLNLTCGKIQTFVADRSYDLIVSNPPYFQNSVKPNTTARTLARHDDSLSSEDLVDAVHRLLSHDGRFSVVLPSEQCHDFMAIAESRHLYCARRCLVRPTPNHEPKRVLMEFTNTATDSPKDTDMAIELHRHEYSAEYTELAKEFLLKL